MLTNKKTPHVIKASAAIQISNTVTLLQRRAWNVLLYNCYDKLLEEETYQISIEELSRQLSYNSNNRDHLKNLLRELNQHQVEWNILGKDNKTNWGVSNLIASAEIKNGICEYSFSKPLREKLYRPEMYAKISLITQNSFKSKYALALYELCIDYFDVKRQAGETPWITIEQFRQLMGLEADEYAKYKYLYQRIIKNPLNEINRMSNIWVDCDTESRGPGRKITHIKFYIKANPKNKEIPAPQRQKARQILLPDPLIELDNIALFKTLTEEFEISNQKATEILKSTDELVIERSLDYVRSKMKNGNITSSIAGYTIAVIINGGETLSKGQSIVDKQKKIIQEQQLQVESDKRKDAMRDDFNRSILDKTWLLYQGLPLKIKNDFEERFVEEVISKGDKFLQSEYEKKGTASMAVQQMLSGYLKPLLLTDAEIDFDIYYEQQ